MDLFHPKSRLALALPLLGSLIYPGCSTSEVSLGPVPGNTTGERPAYDEDRAAVEYTLRRVVDSFKVQNLKVTLPEGQFRITIFELDLSGGDGTDNITGRTEIFSQAYVRTRYDGPVEIGSGEISANRTFMEISGYGPHGYLQQTVFFKGGDEKMTTKVDEPG